MADDLFPLTTAKDEAEILLMDVADKIQLTPTQHGEAERNYHSLADWVDGPGSVLQGKVLDVYPSGSFAIGAPILGKIKSQQHDLDAVIPLALSPTADPKTVLELLEQAIKREEGTRYHDKTRRNSRCVTVTYGDGRSVDLMPVVRLPGTPEKVSTLFHWKADTGESYHKQVNPKGFADYFLARVRVSVLFEKAYARRRLVTKADAKPLPALVPLDQKAPRIVALQLIKRKRDVAYRRAEFNGVRKPPSVVLAAMALDAVVASDYLVDEVIAVATTIRDAIRAESAFGRVLQVANPAWTPDIFTDRWPETVAVQEMFARELDGLIKDMQRLAREYLTAYERIEILKRHFGETAANHAVDRLGEIYEAQRGQGRTRVGASGAVSILPAGAEALTKRTPFGGDRD
jgi:hypothetical protein